MEVIDEAHLKHCDVCGNKAQKPIPYRGHVFCSVMRKKALVSNEEKIESDERENCV